MENSVEIIGVTWLVVYFCIIMYSLWDLRARIISGKDDRIRGDDLSSIFCLGCMWPILLVIVVIAYSFIGFGKAVSYLIHLSIPKSKR